MEARKRDKGRKEGGSSQHTKGDARKGQADSVSEVPRVALAPVARLGGTSSSTPKRLRFNSRSGRRQC